MCAICAELNMGPLKNGSLGSSVSVQCNCRDLVPMEDYWKLCISCCVEYGS